MKRWSEGQLSFNLEGFDETSADAEERRVAPDVARQMSEASRQAFELRRDGDELQASPDWIGEYERLRELGWPWRVACYIAWAAQPKERRWPRTLGQLARDVLGLSGPRVVYTWRSKYSGIDSVVAMLQAAPLWEHRADVIRALVDVATRPDYKSHNDRKLFLEMTGDYTPRSQVELGKAAKDLSELSDADLEALAGSSRITGQGEDDPETLDMDELDKRLDGLGAG